MRLGDMPARPKTRLLRVLADGEVYRVRRPYADQGTMCAIIAATHQNLRPGGKAALREDLSTVSKVIRIQYSQTRRAP